MAEIFESYWWLLFPLGFFIAGGWNSFMRYKRTQAKIELLKSYAASGKEPPAELVAALDKDEDSDWDSGSDEESGKSGGGNAFLVILFAGLAGVFAYSGYTGLIADVGEEFYFIALILGVLSLAFLASSLFKRG
ncbi:hypothetical protein [Maricaulis sp. CAU 1757]